MKPMTTIQFNFMGGKRTVHSYTTAERFRQIQNDRVLTKEDIENLVKDIKLWARENRDAVGWDMGLLYNGKWECNSYDWTAKKRKRKVQEDRDPHDWCEWFPEEFILGMTVDGQMYRILNYGECPIMEAKLAQLLRGYNLYLECADYCYWYATPCCDMEVEYTIWKKEKTVYLYGPDRSDDGSKVPAELNMIMNRWYELAKETGDIGACTIGEYMEFRYEGTKYRMSAQSPYQGDYSWSAHVDKIKELLRSCGAEDIHMNYGRLD